MEDKTKSDISRKIDADKFSKVALACVIFGFLLFVCIIILALAMRNYIDREFFSPGLLISIASIYLVAPIFGLVAFIEIIAEWGTITNPDYISSNRKRVYATAKRFLIASLLFSFVVLFPMLFSPFIGSIMQQYFYIWLPAALIAFIMAFVSFILLGKICKDNPLFLGAIFTIVASLAAITLCIRPTGYVDFLLQRIRYSNKTETFSGNSDSLKQTIVVPTLDSQCTSGNNIIWCSSFQIAWNQIIDDVIGEPLQVIGAEELASRLNTAKQSADDLDPNSFYAAAGRLEEGIVEKIKKEMAIKFPSHTLPELNYGPVGILSYSYLTVNVPFKHPFRQHDGEFFFTDSKGNKTDVEAFGVWGYGQQYEKVREQIEVLYGHWDRRVSNSDMQKREFVIDLCKNNEVYQVVAAVVEPKETLEKTIEYINTLVEDYKEDEMYQSNFGEVDVLIVPEMFWKIDHRFKELIGKEVANANPAMPIVEAKQEIEFKLDRFGAMLESQAIIIAAMVPRYFNFNRPFLIYMKKRDCEQPFFVMWVDNAELLTRK